MREVCDKNLDKFEMYALRNIFRIPDDLHLDQGSVGSGPLNAIAPPTLSCANLSLK